MVRRSAVAVLVAAALGMAATSAVAQGASRGGAAAKAAAGGDGKDAASRGEGSPLGQLSLNSSNEPIHVKSDELEFDYQANKVVYRGTVNVVQGDVTIDCKELVVNLARAQGKDDLQLQEVVAIGDVVITQGQRKATGGRAVFDQVKRQVTLLENPMLRDGPNEVAGERIVVFLDENRSVVESSPKKRVSAILYPGKNGEKVDVAQQAKTSPAAGQSTKSAPAQDAQPKSPATQEARP
ncbi:lipopolysaccharide transport periplasmic protein LptA [Candidatus Binatia bacterium]|jgi:lipopolysaccharide export system protein LptA|nr:lipopolysaccharide transport periplasmic protein LptA [Candidatus Binatia bacterium]